MRGIWVGSPALLLGVVLTGVRADDPAGRPDVAGSLTARQTIASTPGASTSWGGPSATPAVRLGRPMALRPDGGGRPDSSSGVQLVPTSFNQAPVVGPPAIIRAKGPDILQPMPAGEPAKGPPIIEVPDGRPG